ncbi:hypothetical protein DL768_009247 [Monosporascus sp. mg162]|nr:hypothetical protein DL768_009247 [Monosporascus sp. mg162]
MLFEKAQRLREQVCVIPHLGFSEPVAHGSKQEMIGTAVPLTIPSVTVTRGGDATAVSDGYFSTQPHVLSSGSQSSPDVDGGDDEGPAPPYTPFPSFPLPPSRTGSEISQNRGAEAPIISTRLEIPRPLAHAHTRDTASPATPMSERSIRSFQTANDLERGSLRLTLTRSTTYNQIKPFFSRGSEPFDDSPQPGTMEQPTIGGSQAQARPRAKMNYACEACRSSKVKCLASPHPGICKRCADFKRECVFRTGPRTRRPKNLPPDAIIRPPPGPSKTFSIDFSMPADEDPAAHFDSLREHHERILEGLVLSPEGEDGGEISSLDDLSRTPSSMTTASSSARSSRRPLGELGIQPQFNLDSAEKLLATFRDTLLPHCPIVALPDGADVRSLARDMPFVLLAILAVTSCSTSLQGHSLYDEEFRKVLGLKFVTSSERSLEMLQGLLIYCAWYPFHLRPKNRQVNQYMRMAVDIMQDLELDQEGGYMSLDPQDQLPGIRAFLACHYSLSNYCWAWRRVPPLPYNSWTAHCWDVLEQSSALDGDQTLVWLVRLQHIVDAADKLDQSDMNSKNGNPIDYHQNLMRLGLEAQLREWQRAIPERLAMAPSIFMASLFAEISLVAAPLMRLPQSRNSKNNNQHQQASSSSPSSPPSAIDANKLTAAMVPLRGFFDCVSAFSPTQMLGLCGADRSRLIIALIVALRCSFPVPACPAFDWARAQRVLDLGSHLERLTAEPHDGEGHGQRQQGQEHEGRRMGIGKRGAGGDGTGNGNKSNKKIDVCAAMRVVLRAVKDRYYRNVAASGAAAAAATTSPEAKEGQGRVSPRCPMLDGTLSQYLPMWEGRQVQVQGQRQGSFAGPWPSSSYDALSSQSGSTGGGMATDPLAGAADMPDFMMPMALDHQEDPTGPSDKPPVLCDLWETMTMGWAADAADIDLSGIGGAQYDGFEL